jgi:histidyl-tRNA synthetase
MHFRDRTIELMTQRFQAPRGTQDVLPALQPYWKAVVEAAADVVRLYGFQRIDTPVFEHAELFEKGSGDTTDVVEKEMYVFRDRGEDLLALTPEGTPAIARAYLEHGMGSWPQPVRLFTIKPMFRYDRPQKGRYRQHTQVDCEVIGSPDPLVDAEVIELLWRLLERLGIKNVVARIGSIDDLDARKAYVERLKDYYRPHLDRLSPDSQRRFERNPLRLLDSKDERDLELKVGAPKLVDALSPAAQEHHDAVLAALGAAEIDYVVDPLLVRGLDYYNRTVFEIVPIDDERAQGTIGGGGRYDGLLDILGGPPTPAVGFGSGIERIILEMEKNGVECGGERQVDVFVVHTDPRARSRVFRLAGELRREGLATVLGESGRSMKSQMRSANSHRARYALIVGEHEVDAGTVVVKPLDGRDQVEVELDRVLETIRGE